jgi:hypothetical protein
MLLGYLRAPPKVDIRFDRELYSPGDDLRVRMTLHTDRPGLKVRRAVVELVLENRYTHTAVIRTMEVRTREEGGSSRNISAFERMPTVGNVDRRVSQERVDRVVLGRERLFPGGVIRHRTEVFDFEFKIEAPLVQRTLERRVTYHIDVHFDLPRMRDLQFRKAVPVTI